MTLPDLQHGAETRGLPIAEVGVSNVQLPVAIPMRDGSTLTTIARADLTVDLPADVRGTHMSRFVEALQDGAPLVPARIEPLMDELRTRLEARRVRLRMELPLFLPRFAPATGKPCHGVYAGLFAAEATAAGRVRLTGARALVTTLCPCSKAISNAGAHNQRGRVTAWVEEARPGSIVWFEELIDVVESRGASSPIFPLLKREDEKWVTERAYANPRFVEDVVREVALGLSTLSPRTGWVRVSARNEESIHAHDAYALLESGVCPIRPLALD